MANTASYVSVGNIVAMIARSNKNLVIDRYDVAEWCAEVMNDVGEIGDLVTIKDECHTVKNRQVPLPCQLYRLMAVRRNGCLLNHYTDFRRNGPYLRFDNDGFEITIDYSAIPIDDDGLPLIPGTHKQACYYYCLTKLYTEDFLNGKISGDRYQMFDLKYQGYVVQARQSFANKTANEISEINMIRHNMIRTVRVPNSIP